MNDKEFRRHLAEFAGTSTEPGPACKEERADHCPDPKAATMSNKEFRLHIKALLARQRNEDQPRVEKKPPKSEPSKPSAVAEKKPPAAETAKFKVRRKAK